VEVFLKHVVACYDTVQNVVHGLALLREVEGDRGCDYLAGSAQLGNVGEGLEDRFELGEEG
jgi:hypothetical protein